MDTRFMVDKTASNVQIQLPSMKITLLIIAIIFGIYLNDFTRNYCKKQDKIMNEKKVNKIIKIIIRILRIFVKKNKK